MNLQQLYYFQAISRLKNYTKAAEQLLVAQSSLSHSIGDLERELGVPLFFKVGRNIDITEYGKQFLIHVDRITAELELANQELKNMLNPNMGKIRIALAYTVSNRFIPNMIKGFYENEDNRAIQFEFSEKQAAKIIDAFANTYDELVADAPLLVDDTYGSLRVMSDDVNIRFERRERNQLVSIKVGGEELLQGPMRFNFWRALTDNDRGTRAGSRLGCWRDAGDTPGIYNNTKWSIENYKILDGGKKVVVVSGATVCTQPECKGQVIYTITSKGMEVDMQFFPNDALPEIPEVGLLFELPPDFENLTYLGAGPEENYIDRCNATQIGLYNTTVTDLYTDYLKPQECGNRTGVRYATLVGQKKVFSLVAEPVMELNVSHWLPKEIENTWHGKDLPPVTKTVVRCIARQQGVGGYDSWGAHCNEKYKNKTDKTYRLKFQIRF